MSRCFPYPPPGYERLGTGHEALIESIKLQRGEKAKKDRKDKKTTKKDGEKNRQNGESDKKKHGHKKRHRGERSHNDQKGQEHSKGRKSEIEQSEKSSLTEEHGHPVSSQNLCHSSDSTLNSSKRQKHRPAPDGGHNSGGTIRIRLPFQRQKDADDPHSIERPCSAFTNSDIFVREKVYSSPRGKDDICSTSTSTREDLTFALTKEKPCPSPATPKTFASNSQTSPFFCLYSSNNPLDSKFRELIENWVPPVSKSECMDIEHQEWLFSTKLNVTSETRSFKAPASGSSRRESCSAHWSQVCYLSEADMYALPFTLPF